MLPWLRNSNHGGYAIVTTVVVNMAAFSTVVVNPVLLYVSDSLHHSTEDEVKTVCLQFYSLEELRDAKEQLWKADKDNALGRLIARRASTKADKSDQKDKIIADITDAICKLEEMDALPVFAVTASDLPRVPKVKPHDTLPLSAYQRLADMEEHIASLTAMCTRPPSVPAHVEEELSRLRPLLSRVDEVERRLARPMSYSLALGQGGQKASSSQPQAPQPPPPRPGPPPKPAQGVPAKSAPILKGAGSEEGFVMPKGKRRRRPRKDRVVGQMTGCKLQGGPEPTRDVYVGRLLPHFEVKDIEEHAADEDLQCLEVAKLSSETAPFASFRIKVRLASEARALSSQHWPQGAVVGKFYPPRQKKMTPIHPISSDISSNDDSAPDVLHLNSDPGQGAADDPLRPSVDVTDADPSIDANAIINAAAAAAAETVTM